MQKKKKKKTPYTDVFLCLYDKQWLSPASLLNINTHSYVQQEAIHAKKSNLVLHWAL